MDTHDTLLAYSEWLDSEGLVVPDKPSKDKRSHDALAAEFIQQWEDRPGTARLAGREMVTGQAAADLSADALGLKPVRSLTDVEEIQYAAQGKTVPYVGKPSDKITECQACHCVPGDHHDFNITGIHTFVTRNRHTPRDVVDDQNIQ